MVLLLRDSNRAKAEIPQLATHLAAPVTAPSPLKIEYFPLPSTHGPRYLYINPYIVTENLSSSTPDFLPSQASPPPPSPPLSSPTDSPSPTFLPHTTPLTAAENPTKTLPYLPLSLSPQPPTTIPERKIEPLPLNEPLSNTPPPSEISPPSELRSETPCLPSNDELDDKVGRIIVPTAQILFSFSIAQFRPPTLLRQHDIHIRRSVLELICFFPPPWNATVRSDKLSALAPSLCVKSGCAQPILRVFFGRAVVTWMTWIEEPPGDNYFCLRGCLFQNSKDTNSFFTLGSHVDVYFPPLKSFRISIPIVVCKDPHEQPSIEILLDGCLFGARTFCRPVITSWTEQLPGIEETTTTTLTGFQFAVTALVALISNAIGLPTSKHFPFWRFLWFSVVANMSITVMNLSLILNPVGFYQISKLSMIPACGVMEWILHSEQYSSKVKTSVLVMVIGVDVCTVTDVKVHAKGFICVCVAVFTRSLQQISIASLQKKYSIGSFELLSNTALIQADSLLALGPIIDYYLTRNLILDYKFSSEAMFFILLSCSLAVFRKIRQNPCIGQFSADSFQVLEHVKTMCLLTLGVAVPGMVINSWAMEDEKQYAHTKMVSSAKTGLTEEEIRLLKVEKYEACLKESPAYKQQEDLISYTEVVLHLIAMPKARTFYLRIIEACEELEEAYTKVFLSEVKLVAVRNPFGSRPLVRGRRSNVAVVFVLETCALDLIGEVYEREILPGEVVIVDKEGVQYICLMPHFEPKSCIIEHIYFTLPNYVVFGQSIYESTRKFGTILATESREDCDVVIVVPDSGVAFQQGLIRSHYVGRMFMEPFQKIRDFWLKLKTSLVRAVLEVKRVVVVDDSTVQGTSSSKIVWLFKEAGVKEAHMRISCPSIIASYYYGVDTPNSGKLVPSRMSMGEIHLWWQTLQAGRDPHKLSKRFYRPFEITARAGLMAYHLNSLKLRSSHHLEDKVISEEVGSDTPNNLETDPGPPHTQQTAQDEGTNPITQASQDHNQIPHATEKLS